MIKHAPIKQFKIMRKKVLFQKAERSRHWQPLMARAVPQFEPRSEKTGLRGFRPGPTQTGLHSHTRWLEA